MRVAQRVVGSRDPGHRLGQIRERRRLPSVRASKALSCNRSNARTKRSLVVRLPRRTGGTAPTWLDRMVSRRSWKAPPRARATRAVAVPAEVDHGPLGRQQVERELQAVGGGAGVVDDDRGRARASSGRAYATPSAGGQVGPPVVGVDQRDLTPGNAGQQPGHTAPTMPAPTTATRSPTRGGPSHTALTAVSTVPASTARRAGTPAGTSVTAEARHDIARLMGVEAEDGAAQQIRRARLDLADIEVAVLHRPREVPLLERRAHRVALARRGPRPGRPGTRSLG